MKKVKIAVLALFVSVVSLLFGVEAALAAYPDKPIEWVIWSSPGGGADIFVRSMARILEPLIPQPFVPVNKSGGGGAVGMAYAASKAADGYTILAVTPNFVLTPALGRSPKGPADFDAIARVAVETNVVAVSSKAPYKTWAELVDYAKKNGGVSWGSFGVGTSDHVASAKLAKLAGITARFVPFEGGGDSLASLLGGHIDVLTNNPSELAEQIEAGEVVLLGSFSEERWKPYPTVPSFRELGYDVVVPTWRGVVAPKGTPKEAIDYLASAIEKAIGEKSFQDYLTNNGLEPAFQNGTDFGLFVAEQDAFYKQELASLGLSNKK
ncbi:ABC transporter substrate-binding protein [Synergistales bacterium]|nr:ABC transporter substrate-binding protein [Synergistales bacterium]